MDHYRRGGDWLSQGERILQHLQLVAVMADDLDQLQPRHRIEEVQPDQPLGPCQRDGEHPSTAFDLNMFAQSSSPESDDAPVRAGYGGSHSSNRGRTQIS